jgi:hypothetical protein
VGANDFPADTAREIYKVIQKSLASLRQKVLEVGSDSKVLLNNFLLPTHVILAGALGLLNYPV